MPRHIAAAAGIAGGADEIIGLDPILDGAGYTVQHTPPVAARSGCVGSLCARQRSRCVDLHNGIERRIDRGNAFKACTHHFARRQITPANPAGQLCGRGKNQFVRHRMLPWRRRTKMKGMGDRGAEFLGSPFSRIVSDQKLGFSTSHSFGQRSILHTGACFCVVRPVSKPTAQAGRTAQIMERRPFVARHRPGQHRRHHVVPHESV